MKAFPLVLSLMTVLVIGFSHHEVTSKEPISKTQTAFEVSQLLRSDVQNPQGEVLGTIKDFIVDASGRIEFAILFQKHSTITGDGRNVAIPFDALTYHALPGRFVLNMTMERLSSAPSFDPSEALTNPGFAEDVYRYFGLGPQWTKPEHEKWHRSDQDPFDLVG